MSQTSSKWWMWKSVEQLIKLREEREKEEEREEEERRDPIQLLKMINYILLHKIMWRLSVIHRDGTLSPTMLGRDLNLGICKEFYKQTVLYSNLFGWSSNGEVYPYIHTCVCVCIEIYLLLWGIPIYTYVCVCVCVCVCVNIFATVIGKDKPELAQDCPFPLCFQGL